MGCLLLIIPSSSAPPCTSLSLTYQLANENTFCSYLLLCFVVNVSQAIRGLRLIIVTIMLYIILGLKLQLQSKPYKFLKLNLGTAHLQKHFKLCISWTVYKVFFSLWQKSSRTTLLSWLVTNILRKKCCFMIVKVTLRSAVFVFYL